LAAYRDPQLARSVHVSRQAFEAYVATEGARVDAFRGAVAARGGPSEAELDFSRESLRTLGAWFLKPFVPGPEDQLAPGWEVNIPADHPERPQVWLLDGLGSYFAVALRRRHPGLAWRLHDDRQDDEYLRPVLGSFGGARLWPFQPVAGRRKISMTETNPNPDWLVTIFDYYSSIAPKDATSSPSTAAQDDDLKELEDIELEAISGDPDWNADLWITEAAEPILGEREFERLEKRFAAIPGVERIGWEDREHFLLKVRKGTDLGAARDAIRRALREAYEATTNQETHAE
jgi:hypothetical protein